MSNRVDRYFVTEARYSDAVPASSGRPGTRAGVMRTSEARRKLPEDADRSSAAGRSLVAPLLGMTGAALLHGMTGAALLACPLAAAARAEWPPAPALQVRDDTGVAQPPQSIRINPAGADRWQCEFRFKPDRDGRGVALVGTFNDWNPGATIMRGPDADGFWSAACTLGPGVHQYKFLVDGAWLRDPLNPDGLPDSHGGQNSVLRLGRMAMMHASEAKTGDGQIEGPALEHDPKLPMYFQPLGMNRVLIRYRTLAHDVERVEFVSRDGPRLDLRRIEEDEKFALWEGELQPFRPDLGGAATRPADEPVSFEYTFVISDGKTTASDPKTYRASYAKADIFVTPEWAKDAIWYQIMVDRFRNGNPQTDPPNVRPWTSEWFTPSPWEQASGQTFYNHYVFDRMYGGDLDGLEEKLGYLKDLGVNAIYLNPVFQAPGHHKYNATNYLHIDDAYGGGSDYAVVAATEDLNDRSTWKWTQADQRFLRFLKTAHEAGFRVIIDGVFNHVGPEHPAFTDVKKNGKQSKYADWFDVTSWKPFKYRGWAGFEGLPAFKKSKTGLASRAATEHIFDVTRRWMDPDGDGDPRDGVDGWRLDVPNEIPLPFWSAWRELVKGINPEAYIVGEIWDQADPWLDGRHMDAVMNYPFARAVAAWLFDQPQKIRPSELDRRLRGLRIAYPRAATYVMQNLVDSHDTDRVVSMALNPDRAYDHANRIQDNGPNYNNAKPPAEAYRTARLAALLQMTYVGAPMIYYGDEVGMWGADDPTCRKPMLWEDLQPYEAPDQNFVMKDQLEFYRAAIRLRAEHAALRTGEYRTLLADDENDVFAFLRWNDEEKLIVVLNASDHDHEILVPVPEDSPLVWNGVFGTDKAQFAATGGSTAVVVPAYGGVVLHAAP